MAATVNASHTTTYQRPRFATDGQISALEKMLTKHELYTGHFDRLWKLLKAHRIDVRTPGDGTRMSYDLAVRTTAWLDEQVARLQNPSWQEASLLTPIVRQQQERDSQPQQSALSVTAQPTQRKSAPTAVPYGVYRYNGEVYIVVESKSRPGHTYAKRMVESPPRMTAAGEEVDFEWVYESGIIWKLTEEHRMTLEDARDLMIKYGRCLKCRKHLKAAKTLQTAEETGQMVGPVCRKYFS